MNQRRPRNRAAARLLAALALAASAAATGRLYWWLSASQLHTIRGENDVPGTMNEAAWMRLWPPRLPAAHFLTPLSIRLIAPLSDDRAALVAVSVVAAVAVSVGVARWGLWGEVGSHRGLYAAMLAGVMFLFQSPAALVTDVFADVHHWASLTDLVSLATLLPLVLVTVKIARGDLAQSVASQSVAGRALTLAGLGMVATLAKPSLMLVAWLVIPAWLLAADAPSPRWSGADEPGPSGKPGPSRRPWVEAGAFGATVVIVLVWQAWFLGSGKSPFDSGGGWAVHPFWMFSQPEMRSPLVQAVYLVPVLCFVTVGASYRRDPLVQLSFWLWLASLGPTLMLQETGAQRLDGNFTVGTRLATYLWLAASLRVAIPRALEATNWGAKRPQQALPVTVATALLAAFLALGFVAGLGQLL